MTLDAWSPCPEALTSRVVRMKSLSWVHVFVRVCLVPFPRYHHSYSGRLSFSAKTSVFSENFYTTVKLRYNHSFTSFVKYLNLGLKRCNLAVDGSATAKLQRFCLLSCDLVTLAFDLLTLNSCHTWRVTWPALPPSLKTLRLFVRELRVITVPIDYRRKCLRGHCACAESRDPWVEGQKRLHFWNPRPQFAYSLYNLYWSTTTIKGRLLSSVTNAKALNCVNFLCVTVWPRQ